MYRAEVKRNQHVRTSTDNAKPRKNYEVVKKEGQLIARPETATTPGSRAIQDQRLFSDPSARDQS